MAAGWIHRTIDLIAYGRPYAHVHRAKDFASQRIPGIAHRAVGHDWYQRFGRDWDFSEPYPQAAKDRIERIGRTFGPDLAEEKLSSDSHDLIDRTWDGLSRDERSSWEGFFAWLVYHPEVLLNWAEVDVLTGRIKRIVNGDEIWEDAPEIVGQYKALRAEVSRHHKWRLREILTHCGC